MKKTIKLNPTGWIVFFCLLLVALLMPTRAIIEQPPLKFSALSPAENAPGQGHPKLQSALVRLEEIFRSSGPERAQEFAGLRKMDMVEDSIRVVTVTQRMPNQVQTRMVVSAMKQKIEALGGKIELTYRHLIQNYVPIQSLITLANDPLVKYVRLPLKPIPLEVVSEGVSKTGASQWKNIVPYRAETEAKICILDIGFKGYTSLLGSELPATVQTRSFRADQDIFADEVHGAANAEIVHDMAPNAKLWLVNFETDVEQHDAVDWIIRQKIQVISYSLGWFNAGAGDGTGPICDDVEAAASQGLIWATSAGNAAEDHWEGDFNDPDGDGWHNFSGTDRYLEFHAPANMPIDVFLNWNDWGTWDGYDYSGSSQDFDLYLYFWSGTSWDFVDKSSNSQNGSQWPVEEIGGWYSITAGKWAVSIRKTSSTKPVRLELFTYNNDEAIEYFVSSGSITIPADSASALTVGATSWVDDSLHFYSSWGPTHDGRIKPDLTAPSGVSTSTYGQTAFWGTSASAPHVAGACGLIKGNSPYSMSQVRKILEKRAIDLGESGKDNKFGYGRLNLKQK
jgi:subtilisin family serine protease